MPNPRFVYVIIIGPRGHSHHTLAYCVELKIRFADTQPSPSLHGAVAHRTHAQNVERLKH